MKLTYSELEISADNVFSQPSLEGPFSRFKKIAKPIKTAARMKAITRYFQEHFEDFLDLRDGIMSKHGKLNKEGTAYEFKDNGKAYREEYAELLKVVIEIPGDRIKLSQLLSSTAMSDTDLEILDWLIDDGENERIEFGEEESDKSNGVASKDSDVLELK